MRACVHACVRACVGVCVCVCVCGSNYGNMTVNDARRVLYSSLGVEFWDSLQLDSIVRAVSSSSSTCSCSKSTLLRCSTLVW